MTPSKYLPLLTALFVTILIVSNIIAVKIGAFGGYFLPVAVVLFPLGYVLSDIITEVYGFKAMRRVIWTGFLCNLVAVLAITIGSKIPAAPFFDAQDAYARILGATPRLLIASFIAYLIGEFTNSYILSRLKVKTKGKYLWLRTITSTLIGEGLDSAIFISIAFAGILPAAQLHMLIFTQWLFKVGVEVILTPVTYGAVAALKKTEKIDTFDTNAH
jgi:hypothetical protein